ncbi:MAG TPA: gamma-glutamylcyclotransferase family protein [bacterium]|nr:gamma-glutamylcyclotransferase family protein [bacterium]
MNRRLHPMNDHDTPKENTNGLLKLFVYGTLKRGYWNHDRFCQGVLSVEEAVVTGRLYQFSSSIPILQVPDAHILAHGTSDPLADVATQRRFSEKLAQHLALQPPDAPLGGWGRVCGELLAFNDPESRLPAIDRLEGFNPGGHCLYHRVLIRGLSIAQGHSFISWAYVTDQNGNTIDKLLRISEWP